MTFSSLLYQIVTNPQYGHHLEEKAYNSEIPTYLLRGNTLYMRQGVWQRDFRRWLESVGIDVCDHRTVYQPVIKVENGIVTTWETNLANMGNKFLQMSDTNRSFYYPNLNFVQVGMHPYPKEGRYHVNWSIDNAQRESNRIIYPHYDPKQYFLLPKDIGY